MMLIILTILFFAVREDAKILRQQDETLYFNTFRFKEWQWAVFCVLFMIGALPVYLIRRRTMFRELDGMENPLSLDLRVISDALVVVFGWIFFISLWAFGMEIYNTLFPGSVEEIAGMMLSGILMFGFVLFLVFRITQNYPGKFARFVAWSGNGKPFWQVYAVPFFAGLFFAFISNDIISSRIVQPITPLSKVIEGTTSSFWMFAFLMMAVAVAPLAEELIFRGYFYRVLERVKGTIPAIAVVAAVFAFLHVSQYWGDWAAIAMIAVLGLALSVVRAWTGSVIASTVMHYVYNGALTLLPVLVMILANPVYAEFQMRYPQLTFSEREILLEKSISQYPDFDAAYNDLAWIYAEEGKKLDRAMELVEEALVKSPDNAAYLDTKAEVLFRMGRAEEAIAIEEKLIEMDPAGAEFFRHQIERYKGKSPPVQEE